MNEQNKQLTPLEALKKLLEILDYYKDKAQRNFQTVRIFSELPNYIKEIETALKEYETLQDDFNKLYERTYKEHKALEIIKNKRIDFGYFIRCIEISNEPLLKYNLTVPPFMRITTDEYNLLKEVLL